MNTTLALPAVLSTTGARRVSGAAAPALINEWEIIATFNTIESARPTLNRLKAEGREACLTLIGGLSVVARHRSARRTTPTTTRSAVITRHGSTTVV